MTEESIFANSVVMDLQIVKHVIETTTISAMVFHKCAVTITLKQNWTYFVMGANAHTNPSKYLYQRSMVQDFIITYQAQTLPKTMFEIVDINSITWALQCTEMISNNVSGTIAMYIPIYLYNFEVII